MTTTFKEHGEKAGKVWVEGTGGGIAKLNQRLNNFVASMKNISPKMGEIGEKIASQFSKPIFSILLKLGTAFSAMLPFIGMITGAVVLVGKAFGEAAKKQKKFSDNVRNAAAVNAVFTAGVSGENRSLTEKALLVNALREEYGRQLSRFTEVREGPETKLVCKRRKGF
jgi:hypothetical protein